MFAVLFAVLCGADGSSQGLLSVLAMMVEENMRGQQALALRTQQLQVICARNVQLEAAMHAIRGENHDLRKQLRCALLVIQLLTQRLQTADVEMVDRD